MYKFFLLKVHMYDPKQKSYIPEIVVQRNQPLLGWNFILYQKKMILTEIRITLLQHERNKNLKFPHSLSFSLSFFLFFFFFSPFPEVSLCSQCVMNMDTIQFITFQLNGLGNTDRISNLPKLVSFHFL